MVLEFRFPDVGEGITEGEIVRWLVKEGDKVARDQVIVEVETDKAVAQLPSPQDGIILKIHHKAGDTVKVGETLVTIGEKGEKSPVPQAPKKPIPAPQIQKKESFGVVGDIPESIEIPPIRSSAKAPSADIMVLPAVRRLAKDLQVDLSTVTGTGHQGRITEEDVRRATDKKSQEPALKITKKYDMWGYVDRIPLKGIRKATATHMREAVSSAALVTHMDECDITDLWSLREKEKIKASGTGVHLTFMPFIVKALIQALKKHPYLNASLDDQTEEIILKKYYNIGIAVDLEGGLIVPIVKGVDQKSILQLGKEIQELAEKAKDRKIDLADLKGGTFTITNVGSRGGIFATPIPNHPEAAILATGRMVEKPLVIQGEIKVRKVLPLSLTFDHRILDGAEAAQFINDLKTYLEDPDSLLIGE